VAAVPGRCVVAGDPQPVPKTDLPTPSTLLVGREAVLQEVRTFLGEVRLLTLISWCGVSRCPGFLGATSELDRSRSFILNMMGYGERHAGEFFGALAFEEG
jgi:hypothetical protein